MAAIELVLKKQGMYPKARITAVHFDRLTSNCSMPMQPFVASIGYGNEAIRFPCNGSVNSAL
jgi:hypothetical protein